MIMSQVKQCITHQCYLSRYFSDLTKESVSHFFTRIYIISPCIFNFYGYSNRFSLSSGQLPSSIGPFY